SNILADRLVRLLDAGILARGTAARGQRARYSLTEAGIQTLPVLTALGAWGTRWRHGDTEADSELPSLEDLMDQLRVRHLGEPPVTATTP
ncbi:MAG: HxlR family transcriptional regulator, partial [Schumannella sp.]|nr:HxlR family transcriptional regulator [Schumannella sp.]